ncbi:hypothetical protein G7Z17_g2753 [Neofusicoccum parvum]|nr:hypothetical protein G7Z17_g2753 [Neofusicoccum parvum]
MTFTVLSDADVKGVLTSLTPLDINRLAEALEDALQQFSCRGERQYQPSRAVVTRPNGQISLFMPATTPEFNCVKMIGLPTERNVSGPQDPASAKSIAAVLTLCDASGQAIGVLNAEELTAFRTALGSMLLYRFRKSTENIVVFGAGKQALWHVRLALMLRGSDIRTVTVVNRSAWRSRQLLDTLLKDDQSQRNSDVQIRLFDPSAQSDTQNSLESLLVDADAIFCTTPSTEELFPAEFLTSDKSRGKTRYVAAVGSYRPDMVEIPPSFLNFVVDGGASNNDYGRFGSAIAVDTLHGCLEEAGEIMKAGIVEDPGKILEVGEILNLRSFGVDSENTNKWLRDGLVIYKSVGMGVMDLAMAKEVFGLAIKKNLGVTIPVL